MVSKKINIEHFQESQRIQQGPTKKKSGILSEHCIVNIGNKITFYEFDICSLLKQKVVGTLEMAKKDNTLIRVIPFRSLLAFALNELNVWLNDKAT